jgi:hypothetical protein
MLSGVPPIVRAIIWLLILVIVVILVALVVHSLGGFMWDLRIGHFRLLLGVT